MSDLHPTSEPPVEGKVTVQGEAQAPGAGQTAELRAEQAVELWEMTEGESMRDGHAFTMRAVIASAIRAAEQDAAAAERDECAKVAELANNTAIYNMPGSICESAKEWIAAAIRQRGQR